MLTVGDVASDELAELLARFQMKLHMVAGDEVIPGSYWGDEEAGLVGNVLYARQSTPVHSVLHESCHFICMDSARREQLNRDAGGDYTEENAVCYLQILLADHVQGMDRARMFADMDAWGYSFRLGSSRAWFEGDASDAEAWLNSHALIDQNGKLLWRLRES